MLLSYIKISLRNLRKQRLFSGLNIMGLGIGMAAVWLMLLYIADELSYDRFHEKSGRIYRLAHSASWEGGQFHIPLVSGPFASVIKNDYPEVEQTVRISAEGGGKIKFGKTEVVANAIYFTDSTMGDIFSLKYLYGDRKTALTRPQSIVLTKTLATSLFKDPALAVGKTVMFSNNFPNLVTGVIEDYPAHSHLKFEALRSLPANYNTGWQQFELYTYILLREGTDAAKLEKKLAGFYPKYLQKEMGNLTYKLELQPLTAIHLHSQLEYELSPNGNINTIYVFAAIAALILVIACINYINLYTARSIKRIREVGVRKSIGSQRSQLVAQFLTESFLMTTLSGAVAFLLVIVGLPYFNMLAEKSLSLNLSNNLTGILIAIGFIILIGLVSGLYPALRFSGFRPVIALKGQLGNVAGGSYFRQSLVVFQFAATIVMIASAAFVYKQIYYVNHKDLGFNKSQVLVFHIDKNEVRNQVRSLKDQLLQNAAIEAVAASGNPIGTNYLGSAGMSIETVDGKMPESNQMVQKLSVDSDFLKTMEIKLLSGRNLNSDSEADWFGAALVNESLVKKQGWENPIGKRLRYYIDGNGTTRQAQVVGVISDFHTYSLQHKIEPLVLQLPAPSDRDNIYVRVNPAQTKAALAHIAKTYKSFDPEATPDFHFLDENYAQQYKSEERQGSVMLTFAVLAVLIACLGLFGLAAFAAESRTKEIGVRKVLGASVHSVVMLLSRDFIKLVLVAIAIGTPVAVFAMSKWLENFEYREKLSWWVFAAAGLLAIIIALATVSTQALKSALTNPVKSLRAE